MPALSNQQKKQKRINDLFKSTGFRVPSQVISTRTFFMVDHFRKRIDHSLEILKIIPTVSCPFLNNQRILNKLIRHQLKSEYRQLVNDKNTAILQKYRKLHQASKKKWKQEYLKWIVDTGLHTKEEAVCIRHANPPLSNK